MFSVFPGSEPKYQKDPLKNKNLKIPLKDRELEEALNENFNVQHCHENKYILLFDPKMLWEEPYYYFSIGDCYGMPGYQDYFSEPLQKRISNLNPNDEQFYDILYDIGGLTDFMPLKNVLDELGIWPEIGFYRNIKIRKYLSGVIIPERYYDKKMKLIDLNIDIFVCSDKGIKKINKK